MFGNIGVARILYGVHFFPEKSWLFCSSPSNDGLKLLNQPLPPPNLQKSPKIWLFLCLGVHLVCWGALTNFPCKLRLNNFLRQWGCRCTPLHPLAMPMFGKTYTGQCSLLHTPGTPARGPKTVHACPKTFWEDLLFIGDGRARRIACPMCYTITRIRSLMNLWSSTGLRSVRTATVC